MKQVEQSVKITELADSIKIKAEKFVEQSKYPYSGDLGYVIAKLEDINKFLN